MYKTFSFALLAVAVAAGSVAAAASTRVATLPAPEAKPAFVLERVGQTNYSEAYCTRLAQRCDSGDAKACALYNQGCTD